ncbi:MAG: gliding motility-associated C-terminal domain-containing protein [Pedobacter sp.]|uniref:T9SS type B sorting domain-containing protein n=1 Tax=Pedobacter sp. TaxID=1411316 RepID=UPI002807CAB1|nr:gliding motility-associated C-terminal domain-containing protein [Pedobacter sp.]MDQ8006026.1 gliding motility-associated C-terminal domain-containing protein [Pedobacter sp.]
MKKLIVIILLACVSVVAQGQSSTYINNNFDINAGVPVTWYGDVTFGPDAVVYIEDGATAIFYGKNMTIDPAARFISLPSNGQTGTGVIIFRANNPLYAGYPLQQTLNGGYTSGINPSLPNIEIDNTAGVSLTGNTRVTNTVKFTAGHIFLNNFNLVLDDDAVFTGFDVTKHVVTNGTGVVVKENLANNASFLFPISIAGLDYTPATVANQAAARNINVQVKDYSSSSSVETVFATKGMDRTWQISSNVAGAANVSLQHNAATNTNGAGTNEIAFNNALAYVSQQTALGVWSKTCSGTNGGTPISINIGNNLILPATVDATAFFTKTTVDCADLMVAKTVSNAAPIVGSNVTFTISARNLGLVDATGVRVNDLLPSGYTFVSSTVSVGNYDSVTGVWNIGNLANNATATLTVVARINASGNYSNTATITGIETDPDPANNTSTVTPIPGVLQANLGIVKTVDNASPTIGNNVVFNIVVTNAGPDNATGVVVNDQLLAGYTFVSSNETMGTLSNPAGIWTIGNLAVGQSATLRITAKVNATGSYTNTATVSGNEHDPVLANNTSTVTPVPNAASVDLSILKSASLASTHIGQEFDYILQVKNIGANLATGVVVTDILPEQLSFISTTSSYGAADYSNATRTLTWNVGSIAVGATIELVLKVKANLAGMVTNTAKVTSTETDIDLTNNSSTHIKQIMGLQIPNVITPDGDGKNDTFKIPGLEAYPENNLIIHNRWGNEVWKSTGKTYRNEWDGRGLNGGTYYYVLKLKDSTGRWQVFTGWVTLLKD